MCVCVCVCVLCVCDNCVCGACYPIMPLDADCKPVKFSQEPDISSQECQWLLSTSWSEFDNSAKMTQKLFVKYVCHFVYVAHTHRGFLHNFVCVFVGI